jgi:triosephosphate isomerase
MNMDHVEAIHLSKQVGVLVRQHAYDAVDVAIAPPFVDLRSVSSVIEADRLPLTLTAQHVHPADSGAFTGEVSVAMLRRLGVTRVIVGHSERRALFGMSDDVVAETVQAVLRGGMTAVLCVGEDEHVRDDERAGEFVAGQLASALAGISTKYAEHLVVAYEPVWAIGTGRSADSAQVAEMMAVIREALPDGFGPHVPILYGGSVKADNAGELVTEGDVDGFLVGGASLTADSFVGIVGAVSDCYPVRR